MIFFQQFSAVVPIKLYISSKTHVYRIHTSSTSIKATTTACEEVIECRKFHKILHLILSIGNFMNAGSYMGGAAAFELSVLTNLNDIKNTHNQQTLLHFLVEVLEEKRPDLLNFGEDLAYLHEAAHVNTDDVDEAIKEIDGMLEFVRAELENVIESPPTSDDKFIDVMSSFTSKCHEKLQELMKMQKYMHIRCNEVAYFFAFDIKNYRIMECFKDITRFKDLFAHKSIEIAKSRESGKMTRRNQRLYQKSTASDEYKENNVIGRDLSIKLKRLSAKGLYLDFCIISFLNTS